MDLRTILALVLLIAPIIVVVVLVIQYIDDCIHEDD